MDDKDITGECMLDLPCKRNGDPMTIREYLRSLLPESPLNTDNGLVLTIRIPSSSAQHVKLKYLAARLHCYFLEEKVPDEGLEDVAEAMEDAYEFYSLPTAKSTLPEPIKLGPVKITESRTSLDIVIEDD